MNSGAFGENFPYTNFHELNTDWLIKIAKEFLDKYSTIDDKITEGKTEIETEYNRLSALLNEWYETHSNEIANELASALSTMDARSTQLINEIIQSIPDDYTELSDNVQNIETMLSDAMYKEEFNMAWNSGNRYVKLDGSTTASANWRYTNFIEIPVSLIGMKYSQACSTNSTALANIASVAFYSGTTVETFISAIGLYNSSDPLRDNFVTIPENAKYMRFSFPVASFDLFYAYALYDVSNLIDNDEVKIKTRIARANQSLGFGPSCMLISLKRSAFVLGVDNNGNNRNPNQTQPPYKGVSNAYYWLMNHSGYLFATNCNYSGGTSSPEIEENHYAMRFNGQNYLASPTAPQNVYNFFCIDTANQSFAIYPYATTNIIDIPANYNYAFGVSYELLRNGEIVYTHYGNDDTTKRSPRMIFGWDDNYFHIFFCEGRNNVDGGMTLTEVINRLQTWGITNAVCFDGGGSTCCAVNMQPNTTVKINEYTDYPGVRPTTLNMNYKPVGRSPTLPLNASKAILSYMASVYHEYRPDLLSILSTISGQTVNYVYNETTRLYALNFGEAEP